MTINSHESILILETDAEFAADVAALLEVDYRVVLLTEPRRRPRGRACPYDLVIAAEDALTKHPELAAWLFDQSRAEDTQAVRPQPGPPAILLLRSSPPALDIPHGTFVHPTVRYPGPAELVTQVRAVLDRAARRRHAMDGTGHSVLDGYDDRS